jgi:hypothetical protein
VLRRPLPPSLGSIGAGLGEADHRVHELEQFGGVRGSCWGLGFVALVELAQAGDGGQGGKTRDQAVGGLAEGSAPAPDWPVLRGQGCGGWQGDLGQEGGGAREQPGRVGGALAGDAGGGVREERGQERAGRLAGAQEC